MTRLAWIALGVLLASPAAAAPPPGLQELADTARDPDGDAARLRSALAERPAEHLPAVVFARGSAQLTPQATRILDDMGRALSADRLRVESHAGADRDLAGRRLRAVVAYLVDNCGVDAARVQVVTARRSDDRRVWVVDLGE